MNQIIEIHQMGNTWVTYNPFLFTAHHRDIFPSGNENLGPDVDLSNRTLGNDFQNIDNWNMYHGSQIPGFPHHPHRGFETVTIVEEGYADHFDSLGATGRFGNGDVQWMTAGKGVQHSEMFPLLNRQSENPLELFQIWLNLPKKNKMVHPEYKMLWNEKIPFVKTFDKLGKLSTVKIISGHYNNTQGIPSTANSWASEAKNHVQIWNITIEKDGEWTIPSSPNSVNKAIYFYAGSSIEIDGQTISVKHSIKIDPTQEIKVKAHANTKLLLLEGEPIHEPVAQHGPFVMNTQEEILSAFAEYRQTQFGGWPWDNMEKVHPRDQGRFAQFPDGTLEKP